jgi:hypothetical protein
MDEIILSQEGDPNQEYFYIQLPGFNTSPPRRFIFVPSSTITNTSYKFPLNFGLEVNSSKSIISSMTSFLIFY